jgi:hypothetical protein
MEEGEEEEAPTVAPDADDGPVLVFVLVLVLRVEDSEGSMELTCVEVDPLP